MSFAKDIGVNVNTVKGAWKTNLEVRPERDWENLKGRAVVEDSVTKDRKRWAG